MNFHSIWNTSQSTSWKLHQFWLVECFYDFSLSEGIFDSPQRKQEFQPTTPDGSLEAKIICSVAYYICYSHEHALCLSTLSRFCLDGGFFPEYPFKGNFQTTERENIIIHCCELHYQFGRENERKTKIRKREWEGENWLEAHQWFLHHPNSGYKI